MTERLIRAKGLEIERLKSLVPKILTDCKDYLESYKRLGEGKLTYERIKEVWPEDRDMDHCNGHYILQTRTKNPSSGRINFFYREKNLSGYKGESEFDVHVDSQSLGCEKEVNEMMERIMRSLDTENVKYEEVPFK